jgi:hypothetical protein
VIDAATQSRIKVLLREFMDSWIARQYEELRRIEEEGFSGSTETAVKPAAGRA